jgi:hypothetical protein
LEFAVGRRKEGRKEEEVTLINIETLTWQFGKTLYIFVLGELKVNISINGKSPLLI